MKKTSIAKIIISFAILALIQNAIFAQKAELVVQTGHSESVYSLAYSPDGKLLASGSLDKTIKLWDIETGKELKTFRGLTGSVFGIAFSQDGKIIKGSDSQRTDKFWDVESGKELDENTRQYFLPISEKLHVSVTDGKIIIWDNNGETVKTLPQENESDSSYLLSPNGKILAYINEDDEVSVIEVKSGKKIKTLSEYSDWVQTIAFSPDSKTLAMGNENGSIDIWEMSKYSFFKNLSRHSSDFTSFAFSPNGKIIASGNWIGEIKFWELENGKVLRKVGGHNDYVTSMEFSPDGKLFASGDIDGTIKLWESKSDKYLLMLSGHTSNIDSVAFSPDGKTIASKSWDKTVKLWNSESGQLLKTFQADDPKTKSEVSVVVPDFYTINNYEPISPNGRFQIKRSENGKFSLSDVKTGEKIASLISLDENDWAVVDPDGRFDASPGAQKLMHFVVGLEPIDLEQIKDRYYTPNLLQRIFKGENLDQTRKVSVFTADELYPFAEYALLKANETVVKVKLKNRGGGIGRVQVFVNDAEFLADARPKGFNPKSKSAELKIDFSNAKTLKKGELNSIKIIARNEAGWLRNRGSEIVYLDERKKDDEPQEFYAIIGGVSDYENDAFNLRYSAKDARDFAKAVELGAAKLFGKERVHIRLLASGSEDENAGLTGADSKMFAPTKENFRRTFEEFRKAKSTDVFVVYLAGHGTSINRGGDTGDTYLYLTQEAVTTDKSRLLDEKLRNNTTVSSEELADWIRDIPALKRAMILDTCAAGAVEASLVKPRDLSPDQIKALDRMKDRTGFYVLMGSAADAQSYEATRYGQGLLTYSLLQGMSGAKLRDGEYADINSLFDYASNEVVGMAKGIGGIQQPRIIAPTESRSFDIGQFSPAEKSKFTLAKVKPLILKPAFFNKTANFDDNEISAEVEKTLRDESIIMPRGNGESNFVFVEANEMNDAITPSGVYEINGNQIKVTLILVINKKPYKTITVEGNTEKKKELSQKIVRGIIDNAPIISPAM